MTVVELIKLKPFLLLLLYVMLQLKRPSTSRWSKPMKVYEDTCTMCSHERGKQGQRYQCGAAAVGRNTTPQRRAAQYTHYLSHNSSLQHYSTIAHTVRYDWVPWTQLHVIPETVDNENSGSLLITESWEI